MVISMSIATRIEKVKEAEQRLMDHPMCYSLKHDGRNYVLIFPYEVEGLGGVQCSTKCGKLIALEKLLAACEKAWKDDNSWWLN